MTSSTDTTNTDTTNTNTTNTNTTNTNTTNTSTANTNTTNTNTEDTDTNTTNTEDTDNSVTHNNKNDDDCDNDGNINSGNDISVDNISGNDSSGNDNKSNDIAPKEDRNISQTATNIENNEENYQELGDISSTALVSEEDDLFLPLPFDERYSYTTTAKTLINPEYNKYSIDQDGEGSNSDIDDLFVNGNFSKAFELLDIIASPAITSTLDIQPTTAATYTSESVDTILRSEPFMDESDWDLLLNEIQEDQQQQHQQQVEDEAIDHSSCLCCQNNDLELLQPQDYQDIFDQLEAEYQQQQSYAEEAGGSLQELTFPIETMMDQLSIQPPKEQKEQNQSQQDTAENYEVYYDGLPLYCLPCQDGSNNDKLMTVSRNNNNNESEMMFTKEELSRYENELEINGYIDGNFFDDGSILAPPPQDQHQHQYQQHYQQKESSVYESLPQQRPKAIHLAQSMIDSMQTRTKQLHSLSTSTTTPSSSAPSSKTSQRQCYGHKELIFGASFSPCGTYCASASQDSTIKIWNVKSNSLVSTLIGHDKDSECLRVAWSPFGWNDEGNSNISQNGHTLATGGADGAVKVWKKKHADVEKWYCVSTLDHNLIQQEYKSISKKENNMKLPQINEEKVENEKQNAHDEEEAGKEEKNKNDDVPQIYALQFIKDWKGLPPMNRNMTSTKSHTLMTSSDDFIHLWHIAPTGKGEEMKLERGMDLKFTHLDHGYGGVFVHLHFDNSNVTDKETEEKGTPITTFNQSTSNTNIISEKKAFGGDRNPDNLIFVFDAAQCPGNNLLGVALSDGTLRLVNGRGVCVTILQLPGCQSHLTSFGWDKTGTRLASCVATGHVILWNLHFGKTNDQLTPSCQAVLEGGHSERRPLFGAKYCGGDGEVSLNFCFDLSYFLIG